MPSSLLFLSAQLCRDGFVPLDFIFASFAGEEAAMREFAQSRVAAFDFLLSRRTSFTTPFRL